jgi:hypothetical protein
VSAATSGRAALLTTRFAFASVMPIASVRRVGAGGSAGGDGAVGRGAVAAGRLGPSSPPEAVRTAAVAIATAASEPAARRRRRRSGC